MYFVYILQSLSHKHFYIGYSSDIKRRLEEHNQGRTRSTKPYKPWILIYSEEYSSKYDATKREWYLKHPVGYLEKRAIIVQHQKQGGFA